MDSSKTSAAQFAYESLKSWILSGSLAPGEKIDQDEAARKLSLSRMPIRSGLDRLAAEGLVLKIPRRGVIVSPLSPDSLNQLFDVRAQIEAMAIMLTTTSASEASIQNLYRMLQYQEDSTDHSLFSILERNRSFHRYIVQLSGNEVLLRVFDNLWEQSERYRRMYFQTPNSNSRIQAEHRQIVELIAARRVQEAADFIILHTRTSQRMILLSMERQLPPQQFRLISLSPAPYSENHRTSAVCYNK